MTRVAWLVVAACAAPHRVPAPVAAPVPVLRTLAELEPPPRKLVAPTPVTDTCTGTPSFSVTTTNTTSIDADLCSSANTAVARLPATSGTFQIEVTVLRAVVEGNGLTCDGQVRIQSAGAAFVLGYNRMVTYTGDGEAAAGAHCVDLLIESLIALEVPKAVSPPPAPWVPPALRTWEPISSPVAPAPKPTTLGAAP